MSFVWPNHADVGDDRRFGRKSDLTPEFHSVTVGREFFEIDRRTDDFNFFRSDAVLFDKFCFDDLGVGDDFCATVPIDERAPLLTERIGDAARARHRPAAEKKRETEPMVLGAVAFDQIDAIAAAKKPDAK